MTPAACFLLSLQISAIRSGTRSCWLCPVLSLSPEVSCPWASGVFFDKLGRSVGGLGLRDLRESGGESQRPQNAKKPRINLKDASIH